MLISSLVQLIHLFSIKIVVQNESPRKEPVSVAIVSKINRKTLTVLLYNVKSWRLQSVYCRLYTKEKKNIRFYQFDAYMVFNHLINCVENTCGDHLIIIKISQFILLNAQAKHHSPAVLLVLMLFSEKRFSSSKPQVAKFDHNLLKAVFISSHLLC